MNNLKDKVESQYAPNNHIIILDRVLDKDFNDYIKGKRIVKSKIVATLIYDKTADEANDSIVSSYESLSNKLLLIIVKH